MKPQLTGGIITCGRSQRIKKCLTSIQDSIQLNHRIIIVDSMITNSNSELYKNYPNTQCLAFDSPISPSAARRLIAENADTPYILFLDDDIEVTHKSVYTMFRYLETHQHVDIVGGAWLEYGRFRELGQRLNFGILENEKIVYKSFITVDEVIQLGLTSVQVDGVQATMLVRSKIFNKVNFDPQYDFFFELFDFFLQCYQQGLHIHALPSVIFKHKPGQYTNKTLRQTSNKEDDKKKFVEKWKIHPIGLFSLPSSKSSTSFKKRIVSFIRRGISRV